MFVRQKCGKKLSEHPESRGGTIGICGHIWSCHLPLGQNFTPTLRIHNILSVESARKINPIVSLCWVKEMGLMVWYSFKGRYLSDSIILCNQITKIFKLFFFFHYSSEFSVKDQQFSINLIQTLLKSANFQGNPLPLIQFHFILSTTDTLNYWKCNNSIRPSFNQNICMKRKTSHKNCN